MQRSLLALLVLACCAATAACGDDDPLTPTAPTLPTIVTENFSGTVTRNGANTHTFASQASGTVTATINALAPDDTVRLGLALGTYNGSACQLVITKDDALKSTVVTGSVSALGSLCVRIYDVGALTQPTDYELVVTHP